MITRRAFFRRASAGTGAVAAFTADWGSVVRAAAAGVAGRPAEAVAADEDFWREIQQAFTLDRNMINLNNGGVSPPAHRRTRRQAVPRYRQPGAHVLHVAGARAGDRGGSAALAGEFGCDPEEIAITRNASEALQSGAARHGTEAGRRDRDDQPGLSANDRHVATA